MQLRNLLPLILLVISCKTVQNQSGTTGTTNQSLSPDSSYYAPPAVETEEENAFYHPINDYRAAKPRIFDLLHTRLRLSFDWQEQKVNGIAELKLTPYFYPSDQLTLDAQNFTVSKVAIKDNITEKNLEYEYLGNKLYIELDRVYDRTEELILAVHYTAHPGSVEGEGSNAIRDNKGLYFIDPLDTDPLRPTQFWTQGETTANSAWFPTLDQPNEKCTQEVYLTVPDTMTTLSNGKLISSMENNNGTRTDYWKLDKPHAPYLFMAAAGNFVKTEDRWGKIPLGYYTEPEYQVNARKIFGNTPEMMSFFSDILNYPYPWPVYNQVIVRDFVSGAMENTTASVLMEDLQMSDKELRDTNWDYIIAHELFHHWFGNLVTCESWSNLPLNESFADFGEYLWINHKYGADEGNYHSMIALDNYFEEAKEEKKSLIRYYYDDQEEMFDHHTYEKGGAILKMLKSYLGEEAFFAGLNRYLEENAFRTVEIHQLRIALEEVTGEDLNWFFDQWFFQPGHPVLTVKETYSADTLLLTVTQSQDLETEPLFRLPLFIELFYLDGSEQYPAIINSKKHEFKIPLKEKPLLVLLDAEQELVGEVIHPKTTDQLLHQLKYAENLVARFKAFEELAAADDFPAIKQAIPIALADRSHRITTQALDFLQSAPDYLMDATLRNSVTNLLKNSKSAVRAGSLYALAQYNAKDYQEKLVEGLRDSSYSVQGVALEGLLLIDSLDRSSYFQPFLEESQIDIILPVAAYINAQEEAAYLKWYQQNLRKLRGADKFYLLQYYTEFLIKQDDQTKAAAIPLLTDIAMEDQLIYSRYSAYQLLVILSSSIELRETLLEIKENETDEDLLTLYERL